MAYSNQEFVEIVRDGFKAIGYHDELLVDSYSFADFLSSSYRVRTIPLAGFAQHPPSYKSSGFGIIFANGTYPRINDFIALGAPQLFVVNPYKQEVHRWKTRTQNPQRLETFELRDFTNVIKRNESTWGPESILRAKSISQYNQVQQLDFFDRGLLPVLEREVHLKLDGLFNRALSSVINAHARMEDRELNNQEYRGLFRLIFRLVAAKLLADRQQDDTWLTSDVRFVLDKVHQFYFQTSTPETIPLDIRLKQLLWDEIRAGFHLHNLSLEALAYVYENTFVSNETRRIFDTHATPPEIAEFIVKQLPFEYLPVDNRIVFEPFSGHAPFLTASLSRLRTLLPSNVSIEGRHEYFVRMLHGIEIDSFAREIARYSLILADYPNPNGWKIEEGDAFSTSVFDQYLNKANIVLCNPPYGQFTSDERQSYPDYSSPNKAVEAILRVLAYPPEMLGFILPRSFVNGQIYKDVRKNLMQTYDEISIVALPDIVFQHSEAETVLILAHGRANNDNVNVSRVFISKADASSQARDNLRRDLYAIPIPKITKRDIERIRNLVSKYRAETITQSTSSVLDLIAQINVIVLASYNLPAALLSDLLDYIGHEEQPRVGTSFLEQIRARHAKLVDKMFLEDLTTEELEEYEQINIMLDASEEKYYAKIKNNLATLESLILKTSPG